MAEHDVMTGVMRRNKWYNLFFNQLYYHRFIVRFPMGLYTLFITFFLHFFPSFTSSLSISNLAIFSSHIFLGLPPSTLDLYTFFDKVLIIFIHQMSIPSQPTP